MIWVPFPDILSCVNKADEQSEWECTSCVNQIDGVLHPSNQPLLSVAYCVLSDYSVVIRDKKLPEKPNAGSHVASADKVEYSL